jgi:hypothetical protein
MRHVPYIFVFLIQPVMLSCPMSRADPTILLERFQNHPLPDNGITYGVKESWPCSMDGQGERDDKGVGGKTLHRRDLKAGFWALATGNAWSRAWALSIQLKSPGVISRAFSILLRERISRRFSSLLVMLVLSSFDIRPQNGVNA